MFAIFLSAALLAAQAASETPQGDTNGDTGSESVAWTEAKANRAKVKTAPRFVDGPRAELTAAESALGHHGTVLVEGIIGIDGRMTGVRVKQTSHSPGVDRIAVEAALSSTFTPAKDADGAPLPIIVTMPFDLVLYKSAESMGMMQYTCGQFVRDMDWWKSVNPDKPFSEHELHKLESGMEFAAAVSQAKGDSARLKGFSSDFDQRWVAAIEFCRKKPKVLQRDAIFR